MGKEPGIQYNVLLEHFVPKGRKARRFFHYLVWPKRRISTERHVWIDKRNVILRTFEINDFNTSDVGSISLWDFELLFGIDILFAIFRLVRLLIEDRDIQPCESYFPVCIIIGWKSMTREISLPPSSKGIISFLRDNQSASKW